MDVMSMLLILGEGILMLVTDLLQVCICDTDLSHTITDIVAVYHSQTVHQEQYQYPHFVNMVILN